MNIPRFVIGGERSGVGKSTITVGMLLALRARGVEPQPFKAGPDFLDPMHHSVVLGKPSRNLDTWMFRREIVPSFVRGSRGADIAVIEGVMGLYDGLDGRSEEGSTAHLAKVLKAPVIMIIDASSSARSAGAVALGFKDYDLGVDIAGVIFNNVAGPGHLSMLKDSLRGMECLGGIPSESSVELGSRHLGLVPPGEGADMARYAKIQALIEEHVDLDRVIEIARSAPEIGPRKPLSSARRKRPRTRIGLASDEAFNFYYQDNIDRLQGLGAEIVPFSPLRDSLPEVDGLYFGGGYPELYAKQLEENSVLRRQVRDAFSAEMPIYAECGGMMYASGTFRDLNGRRMSMSGMFDVEVEMTDRLQAIGYVEMEAIRDNVMSMKGWETRGHEFHFSRVSCLGNEEMAYAMKRGRGMVDGKDGLVAHSALASYAHLHFASCPDFARRFVTSCTYARRR
ncbi:MAG: hydrogenobyrinic acid a,c-diamide synthase (glutamine-hydrolyzing) [Methanomassiliicoccus sp.]|nr:hydrogenobyrinic acid a,c-diamide synthase (glutamine-hydrolyzing) [Methanomassiliicoccus sp.]